MTNPTSAQQHPDLTGDMTSAAKSAVPYLVIGGLLSIGGFVLFKMGTRKPKPKSVEDQVAEAVEKKLAAMGLSDATTMRKPEELLAPPPAARTPPLAGPAPPVAAAPAPLPAPPLTPARCPSCGGLLVAGRFCRTCDAAR